MGVSFKFVCFFLYTKNFLHNTNKIAACQRLYIFLLFLIHFCNPIGIIFLVCKLIRQRFIIFNIGRNCFNFYSTTLSRFHIYFQQEKKSNNSHGMIGLNKTSHITCLFYFNNNIDNGESISIKPSDLSMWLCILLYIAINFISLSKIFLY